jgi:hypothetical protein
MSQTSPTTPSHSKRAFVYATLTGCAIALLGGVLIEAGNETAPYGWTMFVILPVATGLVASCFVRPVRAVVLAAILSVLLCFVVLLFTGLEGIVCILMAAPLILVAVIVGALVGAWLSSLVRKRLGPGSNMLLLPVIGLSTVFGAGQIEERLVHADRLETVTTAAIVQGSPTEAWNQVITIEQISADKQPFLLQIGLPVPKRCTLEGNGVDALRICQFESGVIEEQVTKWDPPRQLDVKIIRSTLPGRHWLRFDKASYVIEPISPDATRIIRSTTISSKLQPGWYWRLFERMGVEAEHRYLFESLLTSR